jgi:tyrosyl-DNA phosphodiesterase 2
VLCRETQEKDGGCRMDKVLHCGGVEVVSMERIGEGVMVEDEAVRDEMQKKGLTGFVSDHLGLMVEMRLMDT